LESQYVDVSMKHLVKAVVAGVVDVVVVDAVAVAVDTAVG
jgi:hypothetical protein